VISSVYHNLGGKANELLEEREAVESDKKY